MDPIILPRISDQKPLVSVVSITYNHEPYIRDCLEGFVMQKTNFPVEIIIHDDASTDHTADIIREYYEKRPDLFHVIIERENLYSQNKPIVAPLYEMAQGKYIAVCDGDDYWTDPLKLQKQFDFMESHPDYSLCCHNALVHNISEKLTYTFYKNYPECDFSLDYILTNKDYLIRAASVFFRSMFLPELPKYMGFPHVGDLPLIICMGNNGKVHCFKEVMSVYRLAAKGSWTSKCLSDPTFALNNCVSAIEYLQQVKRLVNKEDAINARISRTILSINHIKFDYKGYRNKYSKLLFKRLSVFGQFLYIGFYVLLFINSFIHFSLIDRVINRMESMMLDSDSATTIFIKPTTAGEFPIAIPRFCASWF